MDPITIAKTVQLAATLAKSRTLRTIVITSLVAQAVLLVGLMLAPSDLAAIMAGRHAQQAFAGVRDDSCPTTLDGQQESTVAGLSGEQIGNAHTIWQTARDSGLPSRAAVIAIATAMQESGLRNLDHGDADSLGLFQQRASWGPRAVRMSPAASARLFYQALVRVHGWQRLPLTVAAQRVQRSAYPSAYARHQRAAQALVDVFAAGYRPGNLDTLGAQAAMGGVMCTNPAGAGSPGGALSCPATGRGVEHGLTPDALRVLRCVHQHWPQIRDFGGVGDRPVGVDRDHQQGRAVDIMIPDPASPAGRQLGDQVADWVQHNAARLGVSYVIWQARIWSVARAREGWRTCGTPAAACYAGPDDTAAHRDHVHVSVHGDTAGTNPSNPSNPKGAAGGVVVLPVAGYTLTARFGECSSHWAACHTGLDFATPTGSEIHAVTGGTVTFTGRAGPYGRLTKIRINPRTEVWYAHQSAQTVHAGEHVTAGQPIGRVGATGNTTGPHLHLEIRLDGAPVDPQPWLTARGARP